jgi:hypothetical protein
MTLCAVHLAVNPVQLPFPDMHELPLSERVESLAYWHGRRARLPWYRVGARREAERMVRAWEGRVRSAIVRDPAAPFRVRADAALLVARARCRSYGRRARNGAVALAAAAGASFAAAEGLLSAL